MFDVLEELDERVADLGNLMRALHQVRARVPKTTRPEREELPLQEVERLRNELEKQKLILQDCLAHIDHSILNCRAQIDEYRQTRSGLVALNERLANLGVAPVVVPNHFPVENLGDLILARLDGLHGKARFDRYPKV